MGAQQLGDPLCDGRPVELRPHTAVNMLESACCKVEMRIEMQSLTRQRVNTLVDKMINM